MNKIDIIKALLSESDAPPVKSTGTFLEIGKIYSIRTVTMIFVGRLKDVNSQEFLFEDVAWIPETERWASFVKDCAHKEAEPYIKPVVIGRGSLIDATEVPKLVVDQK